ncbi:phage tail protein [Achromobacter mucicolens]|uniref:phage tail protein n=1 Tax=Achromobacter mucicolens TaxID=1389922 RepID=UPI002449289F|nr:phage tail protein [Achromobacter mucicolens]MDH0092741.1 phage tail protein [Achromobacter mucicolens]
MMDYPKSVPGVGLVAGRFVNEDPIAGRAGSLIPAEWGNAVTDELLTVIAAAGLLPSESDSGQLLEAINSLVGLAVKGRPLVYPISDLPTQNVGPIVVAECAEVWIWSTSAAYTGYRSPLCGRPLDGHTITPLPSEVDAVGGVVAKAAYPGLWGYAQENGLVVTQAVWTANRGAHYFVDVDSTSFRLPDLRDMFRRFTGTDADTANARTLGSRQRDAMQRISGQMQLRPDDTGSAPILNAATGPFSIIVAGGSTGAARMVSNASPLTQNVVNFDSGLVARVSTETRATNAAYHPRIHA